MAGSTGPACPQALTCRQPRWLFPALCVHSGLQAPGKQPFFLGGGHAGPRPWACTHQPAALTRVGLSSQCSSGPVLPCTVLLGHNLGFLCCSKPHSSSLLTPSFCPLTCHSAQLTLTPKPSAVPLPLARPPSPGSQAGCRDTQKPSCWSDARWSNPTVQCQRGQGATRDPPMTQW